MAGRGGKWQDFENQSTTTTITVLPLEGGKSVKKSTVMYDQGRTGTAKEWSLPAGSYLRVVKTAHFAHNLTYFFTLVAKMGHQNSLAKSCCVCLTPGCPDAGEG